MTRTATFTTTLGTKTWEVNSRRVSDFSDFSTNYELEAENNSAVEGSPLTNKRGLKKQIVSFSSSLNAHFDVDVRNELESWKSWIGQTGILKIGGQTYGPNFMLTKVKLANTHIDTAGRFRYSKLTFTFEESDEEVSASIIAAAERANTDGVNSAVGITCSVIKKALLKSKNPTIQAILRRLK